MKKYYVYVRGERVPYIIRADSERQIRAEWGEDNITTINEG